MKKLRIILPVGLGLILLFAGLRYLLRSTDQGRQAISCASYMKSIGLAGRLWANDRDGHMPTNFICMSNELITPKILHCPGDRDHERVNRWEEFSDSKSAYVMVTPGALDGATNVVFIRCSIHGHVGYADGSVRKRSQSLFNR